MKFSSTIWHSFIDKSLSCHEKDGILYDTFVHRSLGGKMEGSLLNKILSMIVLIVCLPHPASPRCTLASTLINNNNNE